MNRNESAKLFMLVKGNFPSFYKNMDDVQANMTILSWHRLFADIPVEIMIKVVDKHTLEADYPPTIKQMREAALKLIKPESVPSPLEAWEKVRKAINKFGYMRESEALATFDNPTKRAVRLIGWLNMCKADDKQFEFQRKTFIESYNEFGSDIRDEYLLPVGMLKQLQEISKQKGLKQPNEMS